VQGASWCGQEPSPRAPPALSLLIPPAACCPGFCGREPPRGQTRRYSRGQTAKTDRFPRCCPRLFAAAPVAPLQRNGPTPIIPPSYWPLGNSPLHVRPKVETGSGDALGERERRQQLEAQVPCFPTTCWTLDLFLPSSDEHFGSRALPFLSSPPLLSYSRPHIKSSSIPPRISPSKQGHTHLAARPKSFTRSNPQPHKQVSQGHTIFGREDLNCQSKPTATAPFAVSHARAGRFRPSSANLFFSFSSFRRCDDTSKRTK